MVDLKKGSHICTNRIKKCVWVIEKNRWKIGLIQYFICEFLRLPDKMKALFCC